MNTLIGELHKTPAGTLFVRARAPHALPKMSFASLRPQADGSLIMTPLPEFVSARQAGEILGLGEDCVYNLTRTFLRDGSPVLRSTRPAPGRVLIRLTSVLSHLEKCSDSEYWDGCSTPSKALQTEGK